MTGCLLLKAASQLCMCHGKCIRSQCMPLSYIFDDQVLQPTGPANAMVRELQYTAGHTTLALPSPALPRLSLWKLGLRELVTPASATYAGYDTYDHQMHGVRCIVLLCMHALVKCTGNGPDSRSVPCNLETTCGLQTARPPFQRTTCTCVLWRDNFKENRENCHDFIVLYCVRNWEGISVVENLVRHNNRSFRANKLVIVSSNYKQENE